MTVTINKKEKLEVNAKARKSKSFAEFSGRLAHVFKGDPVRFQRKLRKEWDR